jgi:hypothetical protein
MTAMHVFNATGALVRRTAILACMGGLATASAFAADPFSGRYRTTDFRDTGFMQVAPAGEGRWSLSISERGEMPAMLTGGPGQLAIVEAAPALLRARFGDAGVPPALRCLAFAPPVNRLVLCLSAENVTWTLRDANGGVLPEHRTRTGVVSWLGADEAGAEPPRDLRRSAS